MPIAYWIVAMWVSMLAGMGVNDAVHHYQNRIDLPNKVCVVQFPTTENVCKED